MIRKITLLVVFAVLLAPALHADEELKEYLKEGARFPKRHQHEFNVNGGAFLGDQSQSSWVVGGNYHFLINETWGVGAAYAYSPIRVDSNSSFGQSLRSKEQHFMDAELLISNDAAFRAGKHIIECDFYLTLGAGAVWINKEFEPMGVIGGGLRVYMPWTWLAVRVDVNNYLHYTPIATGDAFSADISMVAGVSFLFPKRQPPPLEPEETGENVIQGEDSEKLSTQETASPSSSGTGTLTEESTKESDSP